MEWLRKPEEEAKVLMEGGKSEKLRKPAAAPGLQKLKRVPFIPAFSKQTRRSLSYHSNFCVCRLR